MYLVSLFVLIGFSPFALMAQNAVKYTLAEDRQFASSSDLYGSLFVPFEGKMSHAHYPDPIKAGWVSFEITSLKVNIVERVNFTPGGIQGSTDAEPYTFYISRLDKTGYGYEVSLINRFHRDLQGHLKLYIDEKSQVTMLKYRPSSTDPEHTYFIKRIPKRQRNIDSKFFTHQEDFKVKSLEELMGETLYPFLSFEESSVVDERKVTRIYARDNVDIVFEEKSVIKGKKEKVTRHIFFNTLDGKKFNFLLKKTKEAEYRRKDKVTKVLELQVKEETTQKDYFVILHRGVKSMLKAIEIQRNKTRESVLYYEMRRGKRVVEE
ncbi:MAG: hypothetical protein MK207_06375 [Saprospiraceae bacterium]|nr:hypothetical protein [Saprospiraceae bacterium]